MTKKDYFNNDLLQVHDYEILKKNMPNTFFKTDGGYAFQKNRKFQMFRFSYMKIIFVKDGSIASCIV